MSMRRKAREKQSDLLTASGGLNDKPDDPCCGKLNKASAILRSLSAKLAAALPPWALPRRPSRQRVNNTSENVVFQTSFDGRRLSPWGVEAARRGAIRIVSRPGVAGSFAARITLSPGDIVHKGNRAEMLFKYYDPGRTEYVYSWECMLDPGYADSPLWQALAQWHPQPDVAEGQTWETLQEKLPPVLLMYREGEVYVGMNTPDGTWLEGPKLAFRKGIWHRIAFHARWSLGEDGFVDAWLDGAPLTAFNGSNHRVYMPNMRNKAGNYLKIGLYRDQDINTRNALYVGDLAIRFYEDEAMLEDVVHGRR